MLMVTVPGNRADMAQNEKRMGIIVGVCIGLGCIVICIGIILLRNHCCPPLHALPPAPVLTVTAAAPPGENSAGTPPLHPQGNGEVLWSCQVLRSGGPHHPHTTDFHELDSFMPMLPPNHTSSSNSSSSAVPENKNSDTKGGSNGLVKLNGLRNNGRVKAAYLLMAADLSDGTQVCPPPHPSLLSPQFLINRFSQGQQQQQVPLPVPLVPGLNWLL